MLKKATPKKPQTKQSFVFIVYKLIGYIMVRLVTSFNLFCNTFIFYTHNQILLTHWVRLAKTPIFIFNRFLHERKKMPSTLVDYIKTQFCIYKLDLHRMLSSSKPF